MLTLLYQYGDFSLNIYPFHKGGPITLKGAIHINKSKDQKSFWNNFDFFIEINFWIFFNNLILNMPRVALIHQMLCFNQFLIYVKLKNCADFLFHFEKWFQIILKYVTILGFCLLYYELQLCFICYVYSTSFTCDKKKN